MTDHEKLTRQDEDISAPEFEAEESEDRHTFGNWPEVFGTLLTALLLYLSFGFNG